MMDPKAMPFDLKRMAYGGFKRSSIDSLQRRRVPCIGASKWCDREVDGWPTPAPKPLQRFDRSIVEGPLGPAVWRLAWPTMLQNVIAGLQGIIDHAMVGHFVGYTANAAIGVSWQIIIVVIVFISSLFTGMAVLVARFAGANQPEKVNRVVYQAFLTAIGSRRADGARSATSRRRRCSTS